MEKDPQEYVDAARAFLLDNLKECCAEICKMHGTGVMPDGKVREAIRMLPTGVFGSGRQSIIESELNSLALNALAGNIKGLQNATGF